MSGETYSIYCGDKKITCHGELDIIPASEFSNYTGTLEKEHQMKDKKKLLKMDANERDLYDFGYIDIDKELTCKGRDAFLQYIFETDMDLRTAFEEYVVDLEEEDYDGE